MYQQLDRYKGSLYGALQYNGIEYDPETPDNQVISSPGGVSGIHHHWTKGMYSQDSSYSDIYGGEPPAYVYGEHGGLYQVGQSAPYYMGVFQQPRDKMYTQNQGLMRKDNYAPGMEKDLELIPPPDSSSVTGNNGGAKGLLSEALASGSNLLTPEMKQNLAQNLKDSVTELGSKMKNVVVFPNPWAIFFLLFLLWMSMGFLMYAGEGLITAKLHGGEPLNWKWYFFYAVVFIVLLVIAANYIDISILRLEGV